MKKSILFFIVIGAIMVTNFRSEFSDDLKSPTLINFHFKTASASESLSYWDFFTATGGDVMGSTILWYNAPTHECHDYKCTSLTPPSASAGAKDMNVSYQGASVGIGGVGIDAEYCTSGTSVAHCTDCNLCSEMTF